MLLSMCKYYSVIHVIALLYSYVFEAVYYSLMYDAFE